MSMKEFNMGPDPIAEALRNHFKEAVWRIEMLAQEKGLMPLSGKFRGVFVPENEETSDIPSKFFTVKRNDEGGVLFKEHNISFPIEDPVQLLTSLEGFDALYQAQEGILNYGRDDPTLFIAFIGSFVGEKQSEAKS